jgi:ArsR family transcriptional regulator, zinc-responsive transcriptional repressor
MAEMNELFKYLTISRYSDIIDCMSNPNPLLSDEALNNAAECLKILAHPVRLKILQLLGDKEYRVGALAELCGIRNNVTSEHVRLMQRCGFLHSRKEGTQVYYRICEPHIFEILGCIERKFS